MLRRKPTGFTLIELLTVVAIIGILAAAAVTSFVQYLKRSKFGELKANVEALYRGEEGARKAERQFCPNAVTGVFAAWAGSLPAACNLGPSKCPWLPTDLAAAAQVDWIVEGGTYATYFTSVANVPPVSGVFVNTCAVAPSGPPVPLALGTSLAIGAHSDIDGDGVYSSECLWRPDLDATNAVVGAVPPCPGLGVFQISAAYAPGDGVHAPGQAIEASLPNAAAGQASSIY